VSCRARLEAVESASAGRKSLEGVAAVHRYPTERRPPTATTEPPNHPASKLRAICDTWISSVPA